VEVASHVDPSGHDREGETVGQSPPPRKVAAQPQLGQTEDPTSQDAGLDDDAECPAHSHGPDGGPGGGAEPEGRDRRPLSLASPVDLQARVAERAHTT